MVNSWSGKIIEIKDLDTIEQNNPDLQLENSLRDYFFNHLCGISVLKGGGSLMPYWDDVEEENISRGKIAIVEFNQKKFLADVEPELFGNNLLHKFDRVSLSLLDNQNIVLQSRKDYVNLATGEKFPHGYPYRYVVFQNNRDSTPYLTRLNYYIKQIVMCVKQMRKEIFMSEKRLLFILPEQPDEQDVKYFMQGWKKGTMVVITFQASRKPSKEQRTQGKEGISPHNINFQVYEPKIDQCAWLIRTFNFWLSLAEKLIGIRSDTVDKEKERAPIAEVLNSQASFDSFEKKGWKIRIKGIREYMSVFGEKSEEVNYELQYGRISGKA